MPSPPKSPAIGIRYISDAVKSDHRLLERLLARLMTPPSPSSPSSPSPTTPNNNPPTTTKQDHHHHNQRAALSSRLAWELARHVVAMELFLYPGTASRREGQGQGRERRRDLAVLRGEVRALSSAAASLSKDAAGGSEKKLNAALDALAAHLVGPGRHIAGVERVDLVGVESVLSARESEEMGREFERTLFFIPCGVRDDDDDEGEDGFAPYRSVEGLLDAGPGELRAAMGRFPRE